MPGSTPATSQLDWLSSTTAMIVLSWSKATRDLLKSFTWGIGALRQLFASDDGAISSPPAPYHLAAGGRRIRTLGPPSEGQRFSRLLFPNMRARHRCLRKRSPPRPAAASSSCRSRSDERRAHSPTRRSSGPPDRRHHHPFALITALCFFRVRFISCSCAVALSRGRAPP